MKRRIFLKLAGYAAIAIPSLSCAKSVRPQPNVASGERRGEGGYANDKDATTRYMYASMVKHAMANGWEKLPVGEIMVKCGLLIAGTPYVGGTLEADGPETCRVDLTGLDCVTFFENMLCLARCLRSGKTRYEDFIAALTYTRYRGGVLDGYTSRLHYTSEWISDNVKKSVVKDITAELGGIPFPNTVSFMSANPKYYKPLQVDSELIAKMDGIEKRINAMPRTFIPKDAVAAIEPKLQNGDIIAIATNKAGLDYAHTGMISRTAADQSVLLHASLAKKKVIEDVRISDYLKSVPSHTGISVARPV